jgi:hypothetical protein
MEKNSDGNLKRKRSGSSQSKYSSKSYNSRKKNTRSKKILLNLYININLFRK